MEWKHYSRSDVVHATFFEKAGTYDLPGGPPVTVDSDDTYLVREPDGFSTRKGELFRAQHKVIPDPEARNRLLDALPHIRLAVEMAKVEVPDGTITLAVTAKKTDGSGLMTAHFSGDFLDDVARVLGVFDKPGWMAPEEDASDEG